MNMRFRTIPLVIHGPVVTVEGKVGAGGFYPGNLVELQSTTTDDVYILNTQVADTQIVIANCSALQGKGVEQAHVVGERASLWVPQPGEAFACRITGSVTITKGGVFKKVTGGELVVQGGTGIIVAIALETVIIAGGTTDLVKFRRV